jgi:hypothetical protein
MLVLWLSWIENIFFEAFVNLFSYKFIGFIYGAKENCEKNSINVGDEKGFSTNQGCI